MFLDTEARKQGEVTEAPAKVLDEPAKALLLIADYIEKNGLSCGGAIGSNGMRCIIAAKNDIGKFAWLAGNRAIDRLNSHLFETIGKSVPTWSDSMGEQGRAAEVVAKLREVALS